MKLSPFKNLVLGTGVSFLILFVCLGWSFNSSNNLFRNFSWVEQTYELIDDLKDIELNLSIAESNARAFYVSKDNRFHQNYSQAVLNLWSHLDKIKKNTKHSKTQQQNLNQLTLLLSERVDLFEYTIANRDPSQPWQTPWTDKVFKINSQITLLNKKIGEEAKLDLSTRQEAVYFNLENSHYTIGFSVLIALAVSFLFIYLIYKDLIRQKKIEEELTQINENKNKFFSIIGHDLKGPVNGIASLSRMLIAHKAEMNMDESLYILNSSAEKTANLLDNLLTWSKCQMNRIAFNPEDFNIKDVIQENIIGAVNFAAEKGIDLTYKLDKNFYVHGDKKMIDTITRNLIWNALKFTHPGGTVSISIANNDSSTIISVQDNGIGIPEDALKNLFSLDISPFTRKGTANEEGTGLGLILCKEFVEKNGGTIWVNSIEGKGTCFSFSLKSACIPNHYLLKLADTKKERFRFYKKIRIPVPY